MMDNDDNNLNEDKIREDIESDCEDAEGNYMSLGMCLGMCLGMTVGQFIFDNFATGMCIGMGLGLAIGSSIKKKK